MYTRRRQEIDKYLFKQYKFMKGEILDIGGTKDNNRGKFKPPNNFNGNWKYVNTDSSTNPDFLNSAYKIDLPEDSVDGFLMCEVLEHLEYPEKALKEAFRLLKRGGKGWITIPFIYQYHPHPEDYQRWTSKKIEVVLKEIGFRRIEINPMGGLISVILDLCHSSINRIENQNGFKTRMFRKLHTLFSILIARFDKKLKNQMKWITTGWAVSVTK